MTDNTAKAVNMPVLPQLRTINRKIGTTTFIVSSRMNEKGKGDIISKIARLIQNDTLSNTTKSDKN